MKKAGIPDFREVPELTLFAGSTGRHRLPATLPVLHLPGTPLLVHHLGTRPAPHPGYTTWATRARYSLHHLGYPGPALPCPVYPVLPGPCPTLPCVPWATWALHYPALCTLLLGYPSPATLPRVLLPCPGSLLGSLGSLVIPALRASWEAWNPGYSCSGASWETWNPGYSWASWASSTRETSRRSRLG